MRWLVEGFWCVYTSSLCCSWRSQSWCRRCWRHPGGYLWADGAGLKVCNMLQAIFPQRQQLNRSRPASLWTASWPLWWLSSVHIFLSYWLILRTSMQHGVNLTVYQGFWLGRFKCLSYMNIQPLYHCHQWWPKPLEAGGQLLNQIWVLHGVLCSFMDLASTELNGT